MAELDGIREESIVEQVEIELEDLKELARINPIAWEQLIHIVDNRQNAERIADLEAHLAKAHETVESEHRVVTKAELDRQNGASPATTPA